MLLINASARPSKIHGLGCFTDEDVAEGQIIWRFDSRIDIRLPYEELELLPAPARAFLHTYGYVEMQNNQKLVILCGDHSKHMNHSDNPNVVAGGQQLELDVAARNIKAGEELTCNYYTFDLEAAEKLT